MGWTQNPKVFVGTETASTVSEVVPAYNDGWQVASDKVRPKVGEEPRAKWGDQSTIRM